MEQLNIAGFSPKELYEKMGRTGVYHDGCLVSTYHSTKRDEKRVNFPLFSFPCRINAVSLVVCEKGKVHFTSNLKKHVLQENMMMINLPNSIVKIDELEDSVLHIVSFETDFLKELHIDLHNMLPQFTEVLENPGMTILPEELAEIREIIETLETEIKKQKGKPYQTEIIRGYAGIAGYKTAAIVARAKEAHEANNTKTARSRNEEYFRDFMQHVQQHYTRERSLVFYADLLHITPKYLTTLIKQVSGRTAADWIDESVILEAKNLLKFSTMSVQQIAYYLNFPNQSFFGTYFRRRTGMSPTEYKQS